MARTIHQLYCTHCTYGTSALHRHTGNVRTQPFEYSTRAGSVEQSLSHQTFQRFEKQFFRGIPMAADAPVDIRKRHASNAPWRRLVYSPSVDGLRLLANVCYRTTDTAGRLGSYFAHVLLEEERDGRGPWNPTDCLKLWGASFWQTVDRELADSANESFVLKELHELDKSNCPGYGAIVNDQALTQFLTAAADTLNLRSGGREPPGHNKTATSSNNGNSGPDVFPAPNHRQDAYATGINIDPCLDVFPARWREKKPEERQQLLTDLLHAVMELDLKNQERLTIAVEPGVAALLFYGIFRLLPPASIQHLSFSTFESHLERPTTVLTAHDFADPKSTDLSPEAYRTNGTRGFTVNTYRSATGFKFRHPTSKFAEMMVQAFVSGGGDAIDRLVGQLKASHLTRDQLESLASIYRRLTGFLTSDASSEDFSQLSKIEKQFAGQIVATHLASASDEAIAALANRPAYLIVLDLVSGIAIDPVTRLTERRLVRVLPANNDVRNAFFALPKLSASSKIWWLSKYLDKKERFPQGCPSLWHNDLSQQNAVMPELLQQATPAQISIWRQSVPPEFAWSFAAALGAAAQLDPAKRPILISVVEGLDDDGLCKLLDKPSGRADVLLANIAPDNPRFQRRLIQLSDGIRTAPSEQVQLRVEALLSIAPLLPFLKVSLNRWAGVRDAVKRCGSCAVDAAGRPTRPLEIALCEVLKALAVALSEIETQVSPIEIDVKLVESLLRSWWNPQRQELLQSSIRVIPAIQLSATDDTRLCDFLAGERGAEWRRSLPSDDTSLQQRLRSILDQLPDNVLSLPVFVAGLVAGRQWLGSDAAKLSTWQQLANMLDWIKRLRGGFDSSHEMNGADVIKAASDLAPLIYLAFGNRITCDSSRKKSKKLSGTRCLENLSFATIGDNTLLESMFVVLAIEHEYERQASSNGGGLLAGLLKR